MSMRDKIARAILAKVPQGYGMTKAEAYVYADAVLDALMKPTEEMMEPGRPIDRMALRDCDSIFQAMIRAAKEGK